jgi:4-amino-4-deoxy-L-arabinose transferase-like glycosyltransferase
MISEPLNPSRAASGERVRTISLSGSWDRVGIGAVLVLAGVLNFYGLSREGYANTYYAAAVRSMLANWHNFFFNSFDPGGFVTIDKPPLGFWLQVVSAKIFGFNGVALMLPQAITGVLSVALLYYLVRRVFGGAAGLLAALALAVTPISVVASRNNIIDGTLVFTVLLGAWAVTRAVETGKLRWLLLCAFFVGLGFNIKMLEAFLVVPAFGLMYFLGARIGWGRRIAYLIVAGVALLVISFSWVTAVDLTPASQRPFVDSTTTNSELDLAVGYNGLQRLTGRAAPGGGTRGGPTTGAAGGFTAGETGAEGPLRLLNTQLGGQIGWLLPLAVIGFFAAALGSRRRWPLDDRQLSLVMWGMWLLTMGIFFSVAGFFHTYYLVMMAPAIAALSGIGLVSLWTAYRSSRWGWWLLPTSLLAVAAVQAHLLTDYSSWARWLTPLIVGLCALGAIALVIAHFRPHLGVRLAIPALLLGVAGLLSAPTVWAENSVANSASGLIPRAGPSGSAGTPGVGVFRRGRGGPTFGTGGFQPPKGVAFPRGGRGFGGPRGFGGGDTVNTGLLSYLEKHQGNTKFLVATTNAGTAESYILSTGKPVMAMGGFLGNDPILTAAKVATMVKNGTVRYFLLPSASDSGGAPAQLPKALRTRLGTGGGGLGAGRFGANNGVTQWVQKNCTVVRASQYSSTTSRAGATGVGPGAFGGGEALYSCGTRK